MRIAILTEEDYPFMFEPYIRLLEELTSKGHEVVGILLFPSVLGKYRGYKIHLYYLKTFGLVVFLKLAVRVLYIRLQQIGTWLFGSMPLNYEGMGKKFGVPIQRFRNPNSPEVTEWLKKENTDIIFISFGYIIKEQLIRSARVAVINKHSALLPAFRGLFPVFWALMGGAPVGATVHKVDIGIDTGEILYQKSYSELAKKSIFDYYIRIFSDLPESIIACLEILEGTRKKQVLGEFNPSYFTLPTRTDYKELLKRGYTFV